MANANVRCHKNDGNGHFSRYMSIYAPLAKEVGAAVATWRAVAKSFKLTAAHAERMASAFDHTDLVKALSGSQSGTSAKAGPAHASNMPSTNTKKTSKTKAKAKT